MRQAVLQLKDESGEALAEQLGSLLGRQRREKILSHSPELVLPIPLHWRRRWSRGYNQSAAVARGMAGELRLPVHDGWLIRTRPTPRQPAMSATERWENVRDAFRTSRLCRVRGVRVLLVDDVLTTGATAAAAAAVLVAAGAAQVTVAVLAHR